MMIRELIHRLSLLHPFAKTAAKLGLLTMSAYYITAIYSMLLLRSADSSLRALDLLRTARALAQNAPAPAAAAIAAAYLCDLIVRLSPRSGPK